MSLVSKVIAKQADEIKPRKVAVRNGRTTEKADNILASSSYSLYTSSAQKNYLARTTPDANGFSFQMGSVIDPNSLNLGDIRNVPDVENRVRREMNSIKGGYHGEIQSLTGKVGEDGRFAFDELTERQRVHVQAQILLGNKRMPVGLGMTDGTRFNPDSVVPRSYMNNGRVEYLESTANNASVLSSDLRKGEFDLPSLYDTPYRDDEVGSVVDMMLSDEVMASHMTESMHNPAMAGRIVEDGQDLSITQSWRNLQAEGYTPSKKDLADVRGQKKLSLGVDDAVWDEVGGARAESFRGNKDNLVTRRHYGATDEYADMPMIAYRTDVSPVLKDGKTVAEANPLEMGDSYGDGAVFRFFTGKDAPIPDKSEGILKMSERYGDKQKLADTLQNFLIDNVESIDELTAATGELVDLSKSKLTKGQQSKLVKVLEKEFPDVPRPIQGAVARQFVSGINKNISRTTTARVLTPKKPLMVYDEFGFEPEAVIEQLLGREEFVNQRGRLEELSSALKATSTEADPLYRQNVDEVWDMIEDAGYDPILMHVNTAEPSNGLRQGGAMSYVIRGGRADDVSTKVFRTQEESSAKLRDGTWTRAMVGVGTAAGGASLVPEEAKAEKPKVFRGKAAIKRIEKDEGTLNAIERRVAVEEGYVEGEYLDSEGIVTSGAGQTGEFRGMPFKEVVEIHKDRVRKAIPSYDNLPEYLKEEFVQSMYRGDIRLSPTAVGLFNEREYEAAAIEFLNHEEYRTTDETGIRKRIKSVSDAMRKYGKEVNKDNNNE